MNPQLEALLNDIDDLVTPPDVYLEIRAILDDPMSCANDVGKAVSRDPALAARFLRIANSALFARASEISLVSRAVAVLGTQLVRDIVLVASVADMFAGIDPKVIDVRACWARSVKCGVLAKVLAQAAGVLDSEHVFVEGLLSDIGHMAMYMHQPQIMQGILERGDGDGVRMGELERDELGYDYCEAGAGLAHAWGLPEALEVVIRHHQQPATAEKFELETSIVHIARRLADQRNDSPLTIDAGAVEVVGIDAEQAMALRADAAEAIAEATTTFGALDSAA